VILSFTIAPVNEGVEEKRFVEKVESPNSYFKLSP